MSDGFIALNPGGTSGYVNHHGSPLLVNISPVPLWDGTYPTINWLTSFLPYASGTDPASQDPTGTPYLLWLDTRLPANKLAIALHGWHVRSWQISITGTLTFDFRDESHVYEVEIVEEFSNSSDTGSGDPPNRLTDPGEPWNWTKGVSPDPAHYISLLTYEDGTDEFDVPILRTLQLKVELTFTMERFRFSLGDYAYAAPTKLSGIMGLWVRNPDGSRDPVVVQVDTTGSGDFIDLNEAFALTTHWRGTAGDTIVYSMGSLRIYGESGILATGPIEATVSKWTGSDVVTAAPGDSQVTIVPSAFHVDVTWSTTHPARAPL